MIVANRINRILMAFSDHPDFDFTTDTARVICFNNNGCGRVMPEGENIQQPNHRLGYIPNDIRWALGGRLASTALQVRSHF